MGFKKVRDQIGTVSRKTPSCIIRSDLFIGGRFSAREVRFPAAQEGIDALLGIGGNDILSEGLNFTFQSRTQSMARTLEYAALYAGNGPCCLSGQSAGIGCAISTLLAQKGARVAIMARARSRLEPQKVAVAILEGIVHRRRDVYPAGFRELFGLILSRCAPGLLDRALMRARIT